MDVDFDNPYPPFPREAFFDITIACNHRCFFCSNSKVKKKLFLDTKLAIRLMNEFHDNGTTDIALHANGEPFLHKDLALMTSEAKRIGINYVFIDTNGSLADPEKAKPVLDAGMDSIKFSINAGTRESYKRIHGRDHFDKVISNMIWFSKYRKESGLKYGLYVSMVVTNQTKNEIEILKNIIDPYIDEFNIRACSNQGGNMYENNTTEYIDKNNLLGSLKKSQFINKCPDIFHRITITPEGYATACVVDFKNYLVVADLNKTTIKKAWHSDVYVNLRKQHISGNLEGLICYNCLNNTDNEKYPLLYEFTRE